MRFIVLVKSNSEGGESNRVPTSADIAEMSKFNEQLIKAGVMLSGEGLVPSKEGTRLSWSKSGVKIVDGPFAETKELISGFWTISTRTREEAVEWMRRAPFPEGAQLEIRRIAEATDFAPADQEEILRQRDAAAEQLAKNAQKARA